VQNSAAFTIFDIQQAMGLPLPGVAGQEKMAPAPASGHVNRWDMPEHCREAGVLLLLYPGGSNNFQKDLHIALIRRPDYPGVHSGQISFPGGRRENNETLQSTALRETQEEIGVLPEVLTIIGQLSPLYTPPSNFCIYPFVAFSSARPRFHLDSREVAELVEAPLHLFFDSAYRKQEVWNFEKYGRRRVPFFCILGHKVWGATAMILSEFITLLTR